MPNYNGLTVRLGGDVIVRIGKTPIRSSEDVLARRHGDLAAGQRVDVIVLRDGSAESLGLRSPSAPRARRDNVAAAMSERRRLIIVSNRGPVGYDRDGAGRRIARRGAGGLVSSAAPARLAARRDVDRQRDDG